METEIKSFFLVLLLGVLVALLHSHPDLTTVFNFKLFIFFNLRYRAI